ncbi:hypothetical protein GWK47_034754 [Chionoecetes opilio]|uniref:Uncharacterized protein n=1 Tax=Chionoecetes opilio TaxID=41210 RepID=A0A8J4YHM8_CHIOP|nr:hypothetical protein GWK47_034754 [Chionoecetes opilio]
MDEMKRKHRTSSALLWHRSTREHSPLAHAQIRSYFSHRQLQSYVHFPRAFLHEHRPPHVHMALLQPLVSPLQAWDAPGRLEHTGRQVFVALSRVHPNPLRLEVSLTRTGCQIPVW